MAKKSAYSEIIAEIFRAHYKRGMQSFEFDRTELITYCEKLGVSVPKNVGDVLYSFRYRKDLPGSISKTAKSGHEWIIESKGSSRYEFVLSEINRIEPNSNLLHIKVPNATPEIISRYALSDEQALLAKVRYNRLIDIFLGVTAYSLQSHLRTQVKGIGQIETDELYIGLNRHGSQYVIPVQAKGGSDKLGVTQTKQDLACCAEKFPHLVCRPVSAQFMTDDLIAMFELTFKDGRVMIVEEKHYKLVSAGAITNSDLEIYKRSST